ncbi:MAG: sulfatase-like hydrolase/transferase, partial [Kiritimatiellales bacterium]|nr:sulfatase-like hydrolase/transferase [Kiritimatiellales bacterium]
DSIANNGVRFTDGYVTEPVCSPSRAGMLSGRYQHRFGYVWNVMPHVEGGTDEGLPHTETTLGEYLQQCGYRTGIMGKWHLGASADYNPVNNGFDYFYGFVHEGHYFVPPPYDGVTTLLRKKTLPDGATGRWTAPGGKLLYHDILGDEPLYDLHNPIQRGLKHVQEDRYLTDAFTDEALGFIDRNQKQPFLLYLAYNAVHSPLQGADAYMEKFAHIPDVQRRIFAAMLANLDDGVGKVLGKIRDCGLEEDTLIFFLSDNGGPTRELTSSNLPLSGEKGQLLEGGIRIPFMVQWKNKIPAGETYRRPVVSMDIYATAAAVAGKPVDGTRADGVDLMPYLLGENTGAPHEKLYWKRRNSGALRRGDWKVYRKQSRGKKKAPWELYNLAEDISESNNLAKDNPAKLQELAAEWESLTQTMAP